VIRDDDDNDNDNAEFDVFSIEDVRHQFSDTISLTYGFSSKPSPQPIPFFLPNALHTSSTTYLQAASAYAILPSFPATRKELMPSAHPPNPLTTFMTLVRFSGFLSLVVPHSTHIRLIN